MSIKTVGVGTLHRPKLAFHEFEAIADAAMRAMFWTDGRIESTDSAKVEGNNVLATRKFKAYLRKELRAANFEIWAKGRTWV